MALDHEIKSFTDLAVGDLTSGTASGKLDNDRADKFIRKVFETPGLISDIRTVSMTSDTLVLPKIGLGSRIVRAAPTGTAPYIVDGDGETFANSRNLASDSRYAPTFESVTLNAKEYMAEVHITDDLIENNLEREGFIDTLMAMSIKRIATDMEDLYITSDTSNAALAAEQKLQNGLIKSITSNVYSTSTNVGTGLFRAMQKLLPVRYSADLPNMKFYVNNINEIDYRYGLVSRNTALGDAVVQGDSPVRAMGRSLAVTPFLTNAQCVFTNPKNLILGFQRNIRLETERFPRSRMTAFIFTFKAAYGIEEETAIVKATAVTQPA